MLREPKKRATMQLGDRFRVTDDFNRRIRKLVNHDSPLLGRVGTVVIMSTTEFPYPVAIFEGLEDRYIINDDMIDILAK
jgi:hypothetical protein